MACKLLPPGCTTGSSLDDFSHSRYLQGKEEPSPDDLLPDRAVVHPAQHVSLPRWPAGASVGLPDSAQPECLQVHNAGLWLTDHGDIHIAQTSGTAHRTWSSTWIWSLRIGDFT